MKNNLVVGVLGHRNSGKSTTWNELFNIEVKTGTKTRRLNLTDSEYIELFLINGSPEERDLNVAEIIGDLKPRVVLCSMQYIPNVIKTINYFESNNYSFYVQWLNPGFSDQNNNSNADYLGIINKLLHLDSIISIRNAKFNPSARVQEITEYLYGWAKSRNLLIKY